MGLFVKLLAAAALAVGVAGNVVAAGVDTGDTNPTPAQGDDYGSTVARWTSYEDVANWLHGNFTFDPGRLNTILARTRQSGPSGLLARSAAATFQKRSGYCTDAAAFAIQSLNQLNPDYKARYIYIKNRFGQPHHWVAGFTVNDKIMIIDYGASAEWGAMNGVHGPYDTLAQYGDFLNSLGIAKFGAESVEWRNAFPGQQD